MKAREITTINRTEEKALKKRGRREQNRVKKDSKNEYRSVESVKIGRERYSRCEGKGVGESTELVGLNEGNECEANDV